MFPFPSTHASNPWAGTMGCPSNRCPRSGHGSPLSQRPAWSRPSLACRPVSASPSPPEPYFQAQCPGHPHWAAISPLNCQPRLPWARGPVQAQSGGQEASAMRPELSSQDSSLHSVPLTTPPIHLLSTYCMPTLHIPSTGDMVAGEQVKFLTSWNGHLWPAL